MRVALSVFDMKYAALFSESVVPFMFMGEFLSEHSSRPELFPDDEKFLDYYDDYANQLASAGVFDALLPPKLLASDDGFEVVSDLNRATIMSAINEYALSSPGFAEGAKLDSLRQDALASNEKVEASLARIYDVVGEQDCFFEFSRRSEEQLSGDRKVYLALRDLNLVDTRALTWEDIIEVREDEESLRKLRSLRHFANKNYSDKSLSFVEDDIGLMVHEYERTISKWGMETKIGALEFAFSSKLLLGSSAGALASLVLGAPLPALLSAATGAVFEGARVSLFVAKRRSELEKYAVSNPVGYISHVSELVSK